MIMISIIFFFSGLSALVYQLLWMRHLGFIFGNTVYAGATVLTAFMTGLALGSHIFGKYASKLKRPFRCFALLEWGVAIYAILLPFMFKALPYIYRFAYRHISDELMFLTPVRFVLAFALLIIPTLLMGGTLPVLIQGIAARPETFSKRLAWLYGINTLGAVAGVFASSFLLIPAIGLTYTNLLAATTDLIAGTAAWFACRLITKTSHSPLKAAPPGSSKLSTQAKLAITAATLCGFVALALEVIWFRALILVFGSTTYSFSVMLGIFLLGIALGSIMMAPILDRVRKRITLLSLLILLMGLATFLSLYTFDAGPDFLLNYLKNNDLSWGSMLEARFMISLWHLAAPAMLSGMAFATATSIVRTHEISSSRATGLVYAMNTFGAIVGSFVGGFILLPVLGIASSLFALGIVLIAFGALILVAMLTSKHLRMIAGIAAFVLIGAICWVPPQWNQELLSAGAFFSPFNFIKSDTITLRQTVLNDRLLHYEEALGSTVSVHLSLNEQKYFSVNGKVEADQSQRSMVLQRMIGHLPTLFHPNPQKAVNIGLGAGVSFGALGTHPLEHLEVVEIEPAVQQAANVWGALNHNIMQNTEIILTINDGRNHLFATTNVYDVITADPFEPVMTGAANLYTREYFKLAHDRLKPDGIMGQYLPLYELSLDDYLSIVRSFVDVFPQTALFFTGFDTILIGFKGEMNLNADTLRAHFEIPEVKNSLSEIGFTSPEMLLSMFVADLTQHPEFTQTGILNTDDRPYVEFSAPKSALRYTTDANQAALLGIFTPIPPKWLEGLDQEQADQLRNEHEAVRLMLEASILRSQNNMEGSYQKLMEAHQIAPDNPVVENELVAMLHLAAQSTRQARMNDEAARQFQIILKLDPTDFWALHNLIELGMIAGETEFAGKVLDRAKAAYPESPLIMAAEGKYLFTNDQQTQGLQLINQALDLHPDSLLIAEDLMKLSQLTGNVALMKKASDRIDAIQAFLNQE